MVKNIIQAMTKAIGYKICRVQDMDLIPASSIIEKDFFEIYEKCRPYTTTPIERMYSLYKTVEYIAKHNIPGDLVECGVFKGGSSMIMALALIKMGETERNIYLYDTYAGMPRPTDKDIGFDGKPAIQDWIRYQNKDSCAWNNCSLEEVKHNIFSTGYPIGKLIFIKGKVEDTIPATIPERISVLRLDTDWYEPTYHELKYLFPILSINGVIIIDDYGHFQGAREAVDKYFQEKNIKILLNRVDYSGRIGVKTTVTR